MPEDPTVDPVDAVQFLRSYELHCRYVREAIGMIAHRLIERATAHDTSKLMPDEFGGFCRINKAAREHPYLSDEYRSGMRKEQDTINLHYSRNSHHPEHTTPDKMSWIDLVEMVCDWRAAYLSYGSQGTWRENIERQKKRYNTAFPDGAWWLIDRVARELESGS